MLQGRGTLHQNQIAQGQFGFCLGCVCVVVTIKTSLSLGLLIYQVSHSYLLSLSGACRGLKSSDKECEVTGWYQGLRPETLSRLLPERVSRKPGLVCRSGNTGPQPRRDSWPRNSWFAILKDTPMPATPAEHPLVLRKHPLCQVLRDLKLF